MDIPSNVSMCDLTSFEEITDAIQEIKRKGHPIGGVFHTDFAVMVRPQASAHDHLIDREVGSDRK